MPPSNSDVNRIIDGLREEAHGDRAGMYEAFGSGIQPILEPLADLLEQVTTGENKHRDGIEALVQELDQYVF